MKTICVTMDIAGAVRMLRRKSGGARSGMTDKHGHALSNREAADRLEYLLKGRGHRFLQMCQCDDFDPETGECSGSAVDARHLAAEWLGCDSTGAERVLETHAKAVGMFGGDQ